MQPIQLKRGKDFQDFVQDKWSGLIAGADTRKEVTIDLIKSPGDKGRVRRGRMDIFIEQIDDFVSVIEIKATNWDLIKPRNRIKNLGSHRRQIFRYIDKYLVADELSVCAGIVYPRAPRTPRLKELVEEYHNSWALQVVWFEDDFDLTM